MIKMISISQNCFYLAFLHIMMHQIHVFWMLQFITYWLLKYFTSLLLILESFEIFTFFTTYVNISSPSIVQTRFHDNGLFVSFFYYRHYHFSLVVLYLVLFYTKWLYNDLLNFSFCECISFHTRSICSKLVLLKKKLSFLKLFENSFSKYLICKRILCMQWLFWVVW